MFLFFVCPYCHCFPCDTCLPNVLHVSFMCLFVFVRFALKSLCSLFLACSCVSGSSCSGLFFFGFRDGYGSNPAIPVIRIATRSSPAQIRHHGFQATRRSFQILVFRHSRTCVLGLGTWRVSHFLGPQDPLEMCCVAAVSVSWSGLYILTEAQRHKN